MALFSCVKEEEPALPYVNVDFSINLLAYPDLSNGGTPLKYQHVGYRGNGVIIFPMGYGDHAEFKAYDATCTRNIAEETTAVILDENNATATCPKCKTVYNLLTGYAVNQDFHLQAYAARRTGNDRLRITTY
jgi:nitrite reductase/ring-hydroxylating ferredoxin subunit